MQQDIINDFFQLLISPVEKTLQESLDSEICKQVKFTTISSSEVKDIEDLKENRIIYKIEYATGNSQGILIILIPEELIASIADITMGGSGKDAYKGSLSELEVNSISSIMDKIFKNVESNFQQLYEHNLAFSTSPTLIQKEIPEYSINDEDASFNFAVSNKLVLNDSDEYKIDLLLSNLENIERFMDDLGLSKSNSSLKKPRISSVDLRCLSDVKINITAELGRSRVPIKYALELVRGSLIELDTLNNSDIKVFANGIEFANAQVVAIGENFGLKITKVISPEERLENI